MPLVINSLGGNYTHTHTDVRTETILRNQVRAWFIIQLTNCSMYKYNMMLHPS